MEAGGEKRCQSLNCDVVNKRVRSVADDFDEALATRWWDSDDENDIANEATWKLFLGVPVSCWRTAKLTQHNRFLFEGSLEQADQYKRDIEEYYRKIKELNDMLNDDEKFSCVEDSRDIRLISPARGIHAPCGVLVEYTVKAINSSIKYACEVNDDLVIDGCFEFRNWIYGTGNQKHKVRIFGKFGPVDIAFGFIMHAVEATIDVSITRAAKGYDLKALTAFTSGYHDAITLYKSGSGPSPMVPNDGGSPLVVVASSVIAVELHGELKLVFDIKTEEEPGGPSFYRCSGNREAKGSVNTRELSFTAKKHNSCRRVISMGRMFRVVENVTWSTFGGRGA